MVGGGGSSSVIDWTSSLKLGLIPASLLLQIPFSFIGFLQVSGRKSPDSSFRSEKVLKKGYDKVGRVNQPFSALTRTHTLSLCVLIEPVQENRCRGQ